VTPPQNPLAIGFCGAIQLTVVDPATKEVPRNPQGYRVTMADFDVAVSGASVAGHQIDATHFDVCACQGGAVGTLATITASYPARALGVRARADVAPFQTTATFALGAAKGPVNPQACLATGAATPAAPTSGTTAAPTGGAIAGAVLPGSAAGRAGPYTPGPVTVTLGINANGAWYTPAPVTVGVAMTANGSWYVPAPVTVNLGISAAGSWMPTKAGAGSGPLQPAPPRP
jgi:hypothetical protein